MKIDKTSVVPLPVTTWTIKLSDEECKALVVGLGNCSMTYINDKDKRRMIYDLYDELYKANYEDR